MSNSVIAAADLELLNDMTEIWSYDIPVECGEVSDETAAEICALGYYGHEITKANNEALSAGKPFVSKPYVFAIHSYDGVSEEGFEDKKDLIEHALQYYAGPDHALLYSETSFTSDERTCYLTGATLKDLDAARA